MCGRVNAKAKGDGRRDGRFLPSSLQLPPAARAPGLGHTLTFHQLHFTFPLTCSQRILL